MGKDLNVLQCTLETIDMEQFNLYCMLARPWDTTT
jgi:hypothetical protein